MDSSMDIKNGKSNPCAFGKLPLELVQRIMGHLDLKGLLAMIRTSSNINGIFKAAQEVILYHVIFNELGPDIFPLAILHYACLDPNLKVDAGAVVTSKSHIPTPAVLLHFNNEELYIDATRYQMSKHIFTRAVAYKVLSTYKQIHHDMEQFIDWVHGTFTMHNMSPPQEGCFSATERLHMQLCIYVADCARILFPDEYQLDEQNRWTTVIFSRENLEWVVVNKVPENDPPFGIRSANYICDIARVVRHRTRT
ncbi:uncharacterized protein GGS22DRAFT_185670 [Annulohypoxylon maeteangense]|uniref:uncharacterized protein n=1 Tax=Annulohypoxylon maeteangense TaxID=1927788 RepID=UPI002007CD28|nr:uncharacterized protein GGS22DRAFT_185670 [Annulohypoxylon maeteangense]KAI0888291.1 hypothetical protein GGS22DRAFT_185670 [Annulohypoxylon maeteangense]